MWKIVGYCLPLGVLTALFGIRGVAVSIGAEPDSAKSPACEVAILWKSAPPLAQFLVRGAQLEASNVVQGEGEIEGEGFTFHSVGQAARIELRVIEARLDPGPGGATVSVRTAEHPFTFFVRDVTSEYPIYLPDFGAIVTVAEDNRAYVEIEQAVRDRGGKTLLDRYESEPEESFSTAADQTRCLNLPTWLGLSRDCRMFEITTQNNTLMPESLKTDRIDARFFGEGRQSFPFMLGKGVNAAETMRRRLEDGTLPILHGVRAQEEVEYRFSAFVTLERSPLTVENIRGTHYLPAEYSMGGNTRVAMTPEQQEQALALMPEETNPELEQTVLYFRARARNIGTAPHYAYFLAPTPNTSLDAERGFFLDHSGDEVAVVARFNGRPLPNEEVSVLLRPGDEATLDCRIPHQPIALARAERLAGQDFDVRLAECRDFWRAKLRQGARIEVPEITIGEMIQAGLLHLDLICFGREPDGPVGPSTGYGPIGSESAPIIQFLDSMGWHDLAERAIQYFLEKQHEDGFIQSYQGYMGEVGPVLWTIGEHYRYTQDEAWARRVAPKVLRSCDYLIRKRREQLDTPGKPGYGMISGNMGDPKDPYPSFTLNGYSYLGLSRVAEMLAGIDPQNSERLLREADAFRRDIREGFFSSLADSPVVPIGDGGWLPSAPPWAGGGGSLFLYTAPEQKHYFTHGSMLTRDCLIGPLYLAFTEILSAREPAALWLSILQSELYCVRNVTPTQPYYSRHPWLQLKQGQIRSFLKAYYNTVTSAMDRETYTFQEHAYGGTVHKTHEEAWFLMQTRWMLYMEDGRTLRLLPGIPRAWMDDGKRIKLENVVSYFGPFTLSTRSDLSQGMIEAEIVCNSDRAPGSVEIRLPHPAGLTANRVEGGEYDPKTESVHIEPFQRRALVRAYFAKTQSGQ
jgi:hypothetical protein